MGFRFTGTVAAGIAIDAHEAEPDPHPVYATDADLAAHTAAGNPHPVYATDADLAAHVAASDPHTGYQQEGQTITQVGFFGTAPAGARPNVAGSRGGNAALANLLTALANLGLITDSTSP